MILLATGTIFGLPTMSFAQERQVDSVVIGIGQDTYVEENAPNTSVWNNRNLYLGYSPLYDKGRTRIYLRPDIETLGSYGIETKDVVRAEIILWQYLAQSTTGYDVELLQPSSDIDIYHLTWNNQPEYRILSQMFFSSETGIKHIDVTEIIKDYLDTNHYTGIALKNRDEYEMGGIFWSSACASAPSDPRCIPGQEPVLTIDYYRNLPPESPMILTPQDNIITGSSSNTYTWTNVTDPNDDAVSYRIVFSLSQDFNSSAYVSEWQATNSVKITLPDGTYYYKIEASDNRSNPAISTSITHIIEIDTTKPSPPIINAEPPYTFGNANTIQWSQDDVNELHKLKYIVQSCREISFSTEVEARETEQIWMSWENLDEYIYYYRVKAQDAAGNESDWSNIVSTTLDHTPPRITTLRISEKYISPYTSIGIKDNCEISFAIEDSTIVDWTLYIENDQRHIVFTQSGNDKEIATSWPVTAQNSSQQLIEEGAYFTYLVVKDSVGQIGKSNVEAVVVDNTPPAQPMIISPQKDTLTNSINNRIHLVTDKYAKHQLIVNDIKISDFEGGSYDQNVDSFKEGENDIKVISTDNAGNTTEISTNFVIDITPPQQPILELAPDTSNKNLDLIIKTNDYDKISIYNLGGLHAQLSQGQNSTRVISNWSADSTYSFYAVSEDNAGNKSAVSKTVQYTTPPNVQVGTGQINEDNYAFPSQPAPNMCYIKFNSTTQQITLRYCTLSNPVIKDITNLTHDHAKYLTTVLGSFNYNFVLEIERVKCKKKTLIDPSTWFGCKEMHDSTYKETKKSYGDSFINYYENNSKTKLQYYKRSTNQSGGVIQYYLTSTDLTGKEVETGSVQMFSLNIEKAWFDYYSQSGMSNKKTVPEATYDPIGGGQNKYFRYPFDNAYGVTQWHGNTAYQTPHTGIDFGVYMVPIYAVADGYIRYVGWNGDPNACLNGGRFTLIQHDNGIYSAYAHLTNYNKSNGIPWQNGERVYKGDLIGYTGNSGKYNCQNLGYHLHFELRTNQWISSHINPVPYLDVDWNGIVTIDSKTYPGRLTGDNPHPTY